MAELRERERVITGISVIFLARNFTLSNDDGEDGFFFFRIMDGSYYESVVSVMRYSVNTV